MNASEVNNAVKRYSAFLTKNRVHFKRETFDEEFRNRREERLEKQKSWTEKDHPPAKSF